MILHMYLKDKNKIKNKKIYQSGLEALFIVKYQCVYKATRLSKITVLDVSPVFKKVF